ncbi:MAG: aminoacyl-tRNA hydrolase [Phycisphaerales bacterium]|nr:aminoacyl-tRNA hydrolase [Phycisphaerales bacterium]
MKLVVGLGNPGRRYEGTRHNVGFDVVAELARRWKTDANAYDKKFEAALGDATFGGERVLLIRPLTFMNLSGASAQAASRFYKTGPADMLVICDDLDLPLGRLRLRATGSAGGQKGLADILTRMGTNDIARLRVGIDKPPRGTATEWVLSRYSPEEREVMEAAIGRAADAVECWIKEGLEPAMNRFNQKAD